MNGNIKFHKATGPAFKTGEKWVDSENRVVTIRFVEKYRNVSGKHTSDYEVVYEDANGVVHDKDAWNFQVRYTHVADLKV